MCAIMAQAQIKVISGGNVGINSTTPLSQFQIFDNYTKLAFGSATAFTDGTGYMGFNAVRQSNGYWLSANNGTKNGGFVMFSDLNGSLCFTPIANTGSSNNVYADSYVSNNVRVKFGTSCFLCVGASSPSSSCTEYFKGWKTIHENTLSYRGTFNIDLSNNDPRIFNTYSSYAMVLYNPNTGNYEDIEARNFIQSSDASLKTNVATITNSLQKVLQLRGVSFNWVNEPQSNMKSYGFLAQEVEQVIPDIVFTNDTSHLKTMNYIGIIPYLVEAIKTQQQTITTQGTRINTLETDLANCCNTGSIKNMQIPNNSNPNQNSKNRTAYLMQNTPNPFNTKTTIRYYIPENITSANLMIFDMQGKLIKTYMVNSKKEGFTEINGGEMQPGMYMYSLIIDGKEIDTKRMILTE